MVKEQNKLSENSTTICFHCFGLASAKASRLQGSCCIQTQGDLSSTQPNLWRHQEHKLITS